MLLLARHGRTAENAEGRILGHRDPPLDRAGRAEAEALARALADVAPRALWTSPLLRARQTAAAVAAATGLEAVVLEALSESDRGAWEGRTLAELEAEDPALVAAFRAGDPGFAFPGGESFAAQVTRTRTAFGAIARGPLPAVAVTHAGIIRAALAVFGRPVPPEAGLAHGATVAFEITPVG